MPTSTTSAHWPGAALVFVLYLGAAGVSAALGSAAGPAQSASIWLAAAVLFAAFMRCPRSPALLLAGWLAAAIWGVLGHQLGWGASAVFGLIEVLAAWLGAMLAAPRALPALSLQACMRLVAGAVLTSVIGASLAALFWFWQDAQSNWSLEWRTWAFSTLVGLLLVVPVAVAYRGFRAQRSGGMTRPQFYAGLAAFVLFLALAWTVFSPGVQKLGTAAATLAYIPMPFLLAASMLWGARGGSVAMLLGGLLIIARSALGGGPFAVEDAFTGEAVVEAQAFVVVWAVLLLFGRGLEDSRRRALQTASEWRLRYERTLAASGVMSVEFDPTDGSATWSPGAEKILGGHMASLQNMADWLSHVDAADHPMAQAAWESACDGHPVARYSYEVQLSESRYAAEVSLAPIFGPDGAVESVAALVRVLNTAQG